MDTATRRILWREEEHCIMSKVRNQAKGLLLPARLVRTIIDCNEPHWQPVTRLTTDKCTLDKYKLCFRSVHFTSPNSNILFWLDLPMVPSESGDKPHQRSTQGLNSHGKCVLTIARTHLMLTMLRLRKWPSLLYSSTQNTGINRFCLWADLQRPCHGDSFDATQLCTIQIQGCDWTMSSRSGYSI